jgi:hypothetical protein
VYDNEWWHFEFRPEGRPQRLPHPGVASVVPEAPDSAARAAGRCEMIGT